MKHLFGLVAVVCMTASCNKEEVLPETYDSGTYINFGTPFLTVSSVSRASSARLLTDFPESARFGVFGYCLAYTPGTGTSNRVIDYQSGSALWELKSSRCPADVLYNVPVTYTRGVCSYEYVGGGPRKWYTDADTQGNNDADDYLYSFFAYYPYGYKGYTVKPADSSTPGAPVITFSMPFDSYVAETVLEASDTPDAMLSVLYNRTRLDGNLQFSFSHILSSLSFAVQNYNENPEQKLKVYSVKLSGTFYKSILLDFNKRDDFYRYLGDTYAGTYEIYRNPQGLDIYYGAQTCPVCENTVLLLPGPKDAPLGPLVRQTSGGKESDIAVTIEYKFYHGEEPSETKKAVISRPATFLPSSGVHYTAQLNFVGDAFVLIFTPDHSDIWEDPNPEGKDDGIIFQ